jgi:RNA polymerase sigma-70 factor (ECF subfamily)
LSHAVLERVYRREYGRVVSMLAARVGLEHVELVEDAVQTAWASALSTWPAQGVPQRPAAWLFRAAHNGVVDRLRTQRRRLDLLQRNPDVGTDSLPDPLLASEVPDAQLAMLFACCDPAVPLESQRVLALEILFGFRVPEVALYLFTSEANVYKRLQRGRATLRKVGLRIDTLRPEDATQRLPAVLSVLHMLFAEGYASLRADLGIRQEVCSEAIRLATLLADHRWGDTPATAALVALMHLHRARLPARTDGVGGLLLLSEQDRSLWDAGQIQEGMRWLARSAAGDAFSRYHAEAGIAAEHCRAPSFAETRWDRVVGCYALLERTAPSAIHRLGHAIALAQWKGPEEGLAFVRAVAPPSWLEGSFPWFAVLADLHRRCGNEREAQRHRGLALDAAPTPAIRALLSRRLG